jgi:hypothetical protein
MGLNSWFINLIITGGAHPVVEKKHPRSRLAQGLEGDVHLSLATFKASTGIQPPKKDKTVK